MTKKGPGRPPKFSEPSRPITVTLPERILEKLQKVDSDRAAAITKVTDHFIPDAENRANLLEIVPINDNNGLIVICYSQILAQLPHVQLIEVSPQRYIISMQPGTSVDSFELTLKDIIENKPAKATAELPLLQKLCNILTKIRREQGMQKAEILLVSVQD
jgi:hypothetical protein